MGLAADLSSRAARPRIERLLPAAFVAIGLLGAFGGARPTGIGWIDAVVLGLGGAAAAACAVHARPIPLYAAAAAAALSQPATVPLVLGCVALAVAFTRGFGRDRPLVGAVAGGLAWAAAVGAPGQPGGRPLVVPLLALGWMMVSARQHGERRFRERFDRVATVVGGTVALACALGALSVVDAHSHIDRGATLLESGLAAARAGDTEAAVADLRAAHEALQQGDARLGALWARPAWAVPMVSQNVRSLHRAAGEVAALARAGIRAVDEADLDALRAQAGQVDLAAVAATEAPLAEVVAQLQATRRTVDELTEAWLLPPVRSRLDDLHAKVVDAIPSAQLALDGVRLAPDLLGGDRPRTYLVLFTTPVEARARTGFPGNFAEVTFTDGRFDMTRFGRISELNDGGLGAARTLSGPADYLERYARFAPAEDWRSIPMSPDFPTVAAVAAELYPQSGGRAVDGVMSIDPVALAALLHFTGPIAVPGVAAPLDETNAAPFLLRDQYSALSDTTARVDVLEQLAELAFDRLSAANLPGPRELGEILGPVVDQGHLQVMTSADDTASFLDRLGISGRYPAVDGDFVGVTTSNLAGNKIDLFLRRTLTYDVTWDPTSGDLAATVTITLTNDAPSTGLPDYVIGNPPGTRGPDGQLPRGWNSTLLTLYTPWDRTAATIDGEPLLLEDLDELERHALSAFVTIAPGATRTIVVELAGSLDGATYRLGLAAQPLVTPEHATIRVAIPGDGALEPTGPLVVRGRRAAGELSLVRDTRVSLTP